MQENNEIKPYENNISEQKTKQYHERNSVNTKNMGISSSNIHLNFINEDLLNNETSILNMKDNKTVSDSDNKIEIYFNNIKKKREEEEEKEKQLIILYNKYYNYYTNQNYESLINEIENIKNLFHKNSKVSFKINLLKMRCLLKFMKDQYFKLIKIKNEKTNFLELDKKILKLQKEFEIISEYINPDDRDDYEQITQIYGKFLLYLSIIYRLRDENIKSFSYIALGINLLKIFFIRRKVASNIKTYLTYCQLILFLINYLIGDGNYMRSIFYCQILINILKVIHKKIIKENLSEKYYYKFLEYSGFNYLFISTCLEQRNNYINNNEKIFFCLKNANYFFSLAENNPKINRKPFIKLIIKDYNNNVPLFLSQILIEKYQNIIENENSVKKLSQSGSAENLNKKEKPPDLEIIENRRYEKYKPLENNIYKNILTPSVQNHIEKLDNELISVVYQKKDNEKFIQKSISPKTKKFLFNIELYNILMSNNFRNYITKSNKLQFNNPSKEKQSIESLQRFLNKKIKINEKSDLISDIIRKRNTQSFNIDLSEKKNIINNEIEKIKIKNESKTIFNKKLLRKYSIRSKSVSSNNIFSPINIINNKKIDDDSYKKESVLNLLVSNRKFENPKKFICNRNSNNPLLLLKNSKSEMETAKTIKIENKKDRNYFELIDKNRKKNLKIKSIKRDNIRKNKLKNERSFRYSNSYSILENDFERKYMDKSILSSRYFKKISYLDSLIVKELSFQKKILKLKENSSKMYFGIVEKDLNKNKKQAEESAYHTYLILKNKVNEELKKLNMEDYNDKKETTNILDFPNSNNVFKIFKKYIKDSRDKASNKLRIYSESSKNVKQNNEYKLLDLNHGIKKLNHIISYKNRQLKSFSFNKKLKFRKI